MEEKQSMKIVRITRGKMRSKWTKNPVNSGVAAAARVCWGRRASQISFC